MEKRGKRRRGWTQVRLCGVEGKGSLDWDQGQEYQRDEEGSDGNLKCDARGNGWGFASTRI